MNENKTKLGLTENFEAMLCYVLGWVTGVIFFIVEKESKFVRFHAINFNFCWMYDCFYCFRGNTSIGMACGYYSCSLCCYFVDYFNDKSIQRRNVQIACGWRYGRKAGLIK